MPSAAAWTWLLLAVVPAALALGRVLRKSRVDTIPRSRERVLILGGTSGIGRALAHEYAKRGAYVCVVGRRGDKLDKVVDECRSIDGSTTVLGIKADFTKANDLVRVRGVLQEKWIGLDTMFVVAGVSALQPLLEVAGVREAAQQADTSGVQRAIDVGHAAISGNYTGPLAAAVTFIPLLSKTSVSPSILLLSSLAAVVPAPTRSIYCSTKAASLLLYSSLAIEHKDIAFTFVIPSTVEGDFRASAVDSPRVREADPNLHGLKREAVARRCIRAVDNEERMVYIPNTMAFAPLLYAFCPSFVEAKARKKYNF